MKSLATLLSIISTPIVTLGTTPIVSNIIETINQENWYAATNIECSLEKTVKITSDFGVWNKAYGWVWYQGGWANPGDDSNTIPAYDLRFQNSSLGANTNKIKLGLSNQQIYELKTGKSIPLNSCGYAFDLPSWSAILNNCFYINPSTASSHWSYDPESLSATVDINYIPSHKHIRAVDGTGGTWVQFTLSDTDISASMSATIKFNPSAFSVSGLLNREDNTFTFIIKLNPGANPFDISLTCQNSSWSCSLTRSGLRKPSDEEWAQIPKPIVLPSMSCSYTNGQWSGDYNRVLSPSYHFHHTWGWSFVSRTEVDMKAEWSNLGGGSMSFSDWIWSYTMSMDNPLDE